MDAINVLLTIPANGSVNIPQAGRVFRLLSLQGVSFLDMETDQGSTRIGLGQRYEAREPFSYVRLKNSTSVSAIVRAYIGDALLTDEGGAITLLQRVRENQMYAGAPEAPAVVGQYSHVGLVNPAASSKVGYVVCARPSVSAAGQVSLREITADFATAALEVAMNLTPGGPYGAVLTLSRENNAVLLNTNQLDQVECAANTSNEMLLNGTVIRLPPGAGVCQVVKTVNIGLIGSFKWFEVDE